MKRFYAFLAIAALLYGCSKDNVSTCALNMKNLFTSELKCTKQNEMEINLYVGVYKNKEIYFVDSMCPACSTAAPDHGYDCEGKKVDFEDFRDVSDIKQIYNSCTKKFQE